MARRQPRSWGKGAIVGRVRDVRHINELRTMHMAPNDILLALSIDFHDNLNAGRVEQTIYRLERDIKSRFPDVKRLFIEVQSAAHHDEMLARARIHDDTPAKDAEP